MRFEHMGEEIQQRREHKNERMMARHGVTSKGHG